MEEEGEAAESKQQSELPESHEQHEAKPTEEEEQGQTTDSGSDTTAVTTGAQPLVTETGHGYDVTNSNEDGNTPHPEPERVTDQHRQMQSEYPHAPDAQSDEVSESSSQSRLVLDRAEDSSQVQSPRNELQGKMTHKIFVIGKTGTGKSSLCNKIVGRDDFPTGRSFKPVTTETKQATTVRSGINITVIDTPDISSESKARQKDIVKSWKKLAQGFTYMVVLAVRCDQRYSPAEYHVYRQIRRWWGHRDLCRRLVVAFTFADTREDPSVDMEEELTTVWPELKLVVKDANKRYVLFSNEVGNTDDTPVAQLVNHFKRLQQDLSTEWRFFIGILVFLLVLAFIYFIVILAEINPFRAIMSIPLW